MIDVHSHLNFHLFADDYDSVIKNALKAGVTKIITVGTSIESSQKAVKLANQYTNLYAIVGIHPHHADKITPDWLEQLDALATQKKVIAIGEIGMDYHSYQSNGIVNKAVQQDIFEKQIFLAYRHRLPLQIHNRHAGDDILAILAKQQAMLLPIPGMFHCMAGDIPTLKKVLDLGFFVGFDGNITYKGKAPGETTELHELVRYTPLDRIVIETDSPFLTPIPYRGSRNIPSYAILIGKYIAQIKGISFAEVEEQTIRNTHVLFPLIKQESEDQIK